ncbi:MAG: response regulator [Bacteroidetes bacterium]|nr:response regulator [Bacteroidota bacterium]
MSKLLVIDDQQDNLISIEALLKIYLPGCKVFTAMSGQEGIALAKTEFPDTILLDIIMPEMDGYEVCRVLKQYEITKHIPIVMLTAIKTDTASRIRGLNFGADAFLSKPFEPNELVAQINVMLRLKRGEDTLRSEKTNLEKIIKERTKELWKSEEKYRSLMNDALDTSSVGIFILNKDMQDEWINKAAENFFGLKKEYVIGIDNRYLVSSVLKDNFEDSERFKQRLLAAYNDNTYIDEFECHMLSSENREERWFSYWSQPIKSGLYAGGRIEQYTDITARKLAEQSVRESKDYYQAIFENTGAATIIYQADNTIISANEMFLKLSGYTQDEIIGKKKWIEFVKEESKGDLKLLDPRGKECSCTESHQLEFRFIDKNSVIKDVFLTIKKIPGTQNSVASLLDISDSRQIEKELWKMQKLESIGTLASGIAHDFNNILMGIFGNIAMAKLSLPENAPCMNFILDAEKSMDRARRLTGQLLTFSKGGTPIKESVHLIEFVHDIVRFDFAGSKVKPVFQQDDDLWIAMADKGQLEQVFSNLAINAKEAMPEGGYFFVNLENLKVSEDTVPGLSPGEYIKVTVRDDGAGIPEEYINQVFDPYFTTKQTGNGLGLAVVYSIIQKHNGLLQIDSIIDQGTTITFYLPAVNILQSLKAKDVEKEILHSEQNLNILVMDDEKVVRDIVALLLGRIGYSVETVEDGHQALTRYREMMEQGKSFAAVIMDLTIPGGIGGKDAVKNILEIDPNAKVIVSSGYTDDPIMANYADYGFKGVAAKPYTLTKLRETLNKVL